MGGWRGVHLFGQYLSIQIILQKNILLPPLAVIHNLQLKLPGHKCFSFSRIFSGWEFYCNACTTGQIKISADQALEPAQREPSTISSCSTSLQNSAPKLEDFAKSICLSICFDFYWAWQILRRQRWPPGSGCKICNFNGTPFYVKTQDMAQILYRCKRSTDIFD